MEVYISTGLNKKYLTSSLAKNLIKNKIKDIEFSSGLYEANILKKIKGLKINSQIHNYFPVPKDPFIINLASNNKKIFEKTLSHIKKSINFSKKINSKYFSFHAGFLVDPSVRDFGKSLSSSITNNHNDCINLFINRVNYLAKYAKDRNVKILLENNVITKKNLSKFDKNPFLMSNYSDAIKIMKKCNKNVGLLIDVAHLKVSAKTLNFDPKNYLFKLNKYIEAYHLSDNNGLADSNENISERSWFWKYIKKDASFYTLELRNLKIQNIKKQISLVKKKLDIKN